MILPRATSVFNPAAEHSAPPPLACQQGKREVRPPLRSPKIATFEKDAVYNQADATGFIRRHAPRLRIRKLVEKRPE